MFDTVTPPADVTDDAPARSCADPDDPPAHRQDQRSRHRADTEQQEATATPDAWSASLVTLAATQEQAQKLIQAFQTGAPYMALLGENTSLKQSAGVSDLDLFN